MAATKLFLVTKEDNVVQVTGYLVRAHDKEHAMNLVDAGMYIEETKPETVDTLSSETKTVEEIDPIGEGQSR